MTTFLQRGIAWGRNFLLQAWSDDKRRRSLILSASLIASVVIFGFTPVAGHAVESWGGYAYGLFLDLLQWIVTFLGSLLTLLIDVLIKFAKYNDFGSAIAVDIGWKLVRDVCNMFFIVVLLVSAFATIIQYDSSFHYKQVLPKLLLMAVLINFSRTLILLLVDFSQVVMLTFVNAFQQAAAGNFAKLFGLTDLLQAGVSDPYRNQFSSNEAWDAASNSLLTNLIVTFMLAIILLIIALGVMLVLVIYIVFRIVGLWMVLILSPAAFFLTAVPGKLQKGMGEISKFWSTLGSLLSGGPIVAFFIWLALATVQQSAGNMTGTLGVGFTGVAPTTANNARFDLQSNTRTQAQAGSNFMSNIGNSQGIATFIIGIAMLLMGMQTAVSSAGAISSTAGNLAKRVEGTTIGMAKWVAASPYKGARAVTVGTAKYADRRFDLTGKAATVGLVASPILPKSAVRALGAAAVKNKKQDMKEASEAAENVKLMSRTQAGLYAFGQPTLKGKATRGDTVAYAKVQQERASAEVLKQRTGERQDALVSGWSSSEEAVLAQKKTLKAGLDARLARAAMETDPHEADKLTKGAHKEYQDGLDTIEGELKARAARVAKAQTYDVAARGLDDGRAKLDRYKEENRDELEKQQKLVHQNPLLTADTKEFEAAVGETVAKDGWSDLHADARSSGRVLSEAMDKAGVYKKDRAGNIVGIDEGLLAGLQSKTKSEDVKRNMGALANYVKGKATTSQPLSRSVVDGTMIEKDKAGKRRIYSTSDGQRLMTKDEETFNKQWNGFKARQAAAPGTPITLDDPRDQNDKDINSALEIEKMPARDILADGGEAPETAGTTIGPVMRNLRQRIEKGFSTAHRETDGSEIRGAIGAIEQIIDGVSDFNEAQQDQIFEALNAQHAADVLASKFQHIADKSQMYKLVKLAASRKSPAAKKFRKDLADLLEARKTLGSDVPKALWNAATFEPEEEIKK